MSIRKFANDAIEYAKDGAIRLRDSVLSKWEIVSRPLRDDKGETPFHSLRASDNDKLIGVGKPFNPATYFPLSNAGFIDLIERALEGTGHEIVTVGSTANRAKVFVAVKLDTVPEFVTANRNFQPFLRFLNSFDGSSPLVSNTGNKCFQCSNQWMRILNSKGKMINVRVAHRKGSTQKIENMPELIGAIIGVQAEFAYAMGQFHEVKVNAEKARNIVTGLIAPGNAEELSTRTGNQIDEIVSLYQSGQGNAGETLADLFSGVTDYYTHRSSGGTDDQMRQYSSSAFGSGARIKDTAFELFRDSDKLESLQRRGETLSAQLAKLN